MVAIKFYRYIFIIQVLVLSVIVLCSVDVVSAQNNNKIFVIEGMVYDKNFNTGLIGGMTYLHDENGNVVDSCTIGQTRVWSNELQKGIVQPNWKYKVEHKPTRYTVEVTYPKYETQYLQIDLAGIGKRQQEYIAPDIHMSRSAVKLQDVVVTATKVRFYSKGDTLVYNADAFQLAEGSMLDALIEQLPGVEMKDNGQIFVNGKFVENLTLNGKDFFGNNHRLLLENLGAYTVKDIAVYDKLGKKSDLAGVEIAGDKQFTMDVRLKKEYQENWLLNVEGGGGTSDRYMGRLFLARTSSHATFGLFGNINNLNDQRRPGQNTLWTQENRFPGERKERQAGVSYDVDAKKSGLNLNGTLMYSQTFADVRQTTLRTNLLPQGNTYDNSYVKAYNKELNLTQQHDITFKRKYLSSYLSEYVKYRKYRNASSSASATFNREWQDVTRQMIEDMYMSATAEWRQSLLNRTLAEDKDNGHDFTAHLDVLTFLKMKKSSDNVLFGVEANYREEKKDRFSMYQINYRQDAVPASRLNDYYNVPNRDYDITARLGYNYVFQGGGYIQAQYRYLHAQKNRDSHRYQLDRLADQGVFGILPDKYMSVVDPQNSHTSHYVTNRHELEICVTPTPRLFPSWFSFQIRPVLGYSSEALAYHQVKSYSVRKHFLTLSFLQEFTRLWFGFGGSGNNARRHQIIIGYGLDSRLPDLMHIVPVTDDSDPLNIYKGADNLKVEYQHRLALDWKYRPKRGNINNTLRLGYNITANALTRGYDYDMQTGVRTWRSYNTNGNWTRFANNSFSLVFGSRRQFTLSSDSRVENSQAADVIGTTEKPAAQFAVKNWLLSEGLKLAWTIGKQRIGLNGSFIWRSTSSGHEDFASFHATNVNCGMTGMFKLPGNIGISTDMTLYSRTGYSDNRLNTTDFVWNARLSYTFGKGRWVAMLDGYDLLHQLSNVTYGITAQARTVSYTNTLPRYCMLHLQYRVNLSGKKH